MPARGSARRSSGSAARRKSRAEVAGVEVDVVGAAWSRITPDDRPGHDVARRQLGQLVRPGHEPLAVARRRSNAPSPRTASETSGCWPRASPRRARARSGGTARTPGRSTAAPARSAGGDAVAGGHRAGWWSTGRPGPCRRWPARPPAPSAAPTPSRCPRRCTCRVTPQTRAVVGVVQQVEDQRVLDDLDARVVAHRVAARRSARGEISAPVASPPACAIRSRWWPPSRVSVISPSGVAVELGAERDELAHPARAPR